MSLNLKSSRLQISTGNVLSVPDLRKKAGQKSAEELYDALTVVLREPETRQAEKWTEVRLAGNDLREKMAEHQRNDIKIGAKVFLNSGSEEALRTAVDQLFATLDVTCVDSLILAYHPKARSDGGGGGGRGDGGGKQNGLDPDHSPMVNGDAKEGIISWGAGSKNAFGELLRFWRVLEEYSGDRKLCQLGVSDLDCESLMELHKQAKTPPTITQINLAACCVVPPDLKNFCTENDIQLLTHSDPQEIIDEEMLTKLQLPGYRAEWTVRYQIHVRCRGVLLVKGFIVGASKA